MNDDFFEEDDNIFDENDALDYKLYEEIEKETGKTTSNAGWLTTILFAVSTISCLAIAMICIIQ